MCMTIAPGTLLGWESPAGRACCAPHAKFRHLFFPSQRRTWSLACMQICHLQGLLHEESINCAHATQSLRLLKF